MHDDPHALRRKRLLFRAMHRGFKEADLLIGGFARAMLPTMGVADLDEFEALIAFPDHDLYNWIVGNAPAPANIEGGVFAQLQAFDVAAITAPRG